MQLDWKRLFLSADGRIGRQDFWIGFAILFVANLGLRWIPLVGLLVSIACVYCMVCVGSKRLHDFGKTGWLMVVPSAITLISLVLSGAAVALSVLGARASGGEQAATMGIVTGGILTLVIMCFAALVSLAFLLWVGLTPSQSGENRYGPPAEPAFVNQSSPPAA